MNSRVILFFVLLLSLLSCPVEKKPVKITLWLDLSEEEKEFLESALSKPLLKRKIVIDLEAVAEEEIRERLLGLGPSSKELPDIFELNSFYLTSFKDYVQEISGALFSTEAIRVLQPAGLRRGSSARKLFFLPWKLDWKVMVYNSKFVPLPPKSWAEILKFSRLNPSRLAFSGNNPEGLFSELVSIVWAFGGDPLDLEDKATESALYFIALLSPYIYMDSPLMDEQRLVQKQINEEVLIHFNTKESLVRLNGLGGYPFPSMASIIPAGEEGTRVLLLGDFIGISKSCVHLDQAIEVVNYFYELSLQRALLMKFFWLPARADVYSITDPRLLELLSSHIESQGYLSSLPLDVELDKAAKIYQKIFEAIVMEKRQLPLVQAEYGPKLRELRNGEGGAR